MLNWFEVENFKSIKKLHFDFKPFMVLVGPNGAGKTNIVQALAVLLDMLEAGNTGPLDLYGGFDQLIRREKRPAKSIRLAFQGQVLSSRSLEDMDLRVDFSLASLGQFIGASVHHEEIELKNGGGVLKASYHNRKLEEIEVTNRRIWHDVTYSRKPERVFQHPMIISILEDPTRLVFHAIQWLLFEPIPQMMRLRLDASALRADADPAVLRSLDRALGFSGDGLALLVERLRPPGKKPSPAFVNALAGLRQVYHRIEDVTTVRFQPGRVALSFQEQGIKSPFGQANVSDGVIHALALLLALEVHREAACPLAIEEPENALHPWALKNIVERAQDLSSAEAPIILTTHSPVVVDAVRDVASLFIVETSEKKGTVVTPALSKEKALQSILADSGQKLGAIWLDGTLGGVPGSEP